MSDLKEELVSEFRSHFTTEPLLIRAPGRINLIGEHVDYNEGFVLPGAVDKDFLFALSLNESGLCRIYSHDFGEYAEFSLNELADGRHWSNYFMGVVDGFRLRGKALKGIDCVFGGTIPSGGGLSSSAALCCGFGFGVNELNGCGLKKLDLALIAQHAEHEFAGVKCGLMDQYASLFGERDSLLLLDCRSLTHEVIHFPSHLCSIVLADTRVKHSLASSAYNDRRAACEEGVSRLMTMYPAIESLRDVTINQLESARKLLSPEVFQRCQYVVMEMERTQRVASALRGGNLAEVGQLMFATHDGLSTEYEVSCAELDTLVTTAQRNPELVIGSRMMGGGFGGCSINLVRPGKTESFKTLISTEYFTSFRNTPEFYTVTLAGGTHRVDI
jgi:galactokinase